MRTAVLHEVVLAAAARWGKRPALRHIYGGKSREIFYENLPRLTYLFAEALARRGVKPGDRVVLCADNCPEWVIACIAALRLGATVVPVDSRSRQSDVEMVAEKVKPVLFVLGRLQFGLLRETLDEARVLLLDEFLNGVTRDTADGGARPFIDFRHVSEDTPALIVFTSGTSGVSKGVVLTHANIAANVKEIVKRFRVDNTDRLLSVLPLSHMFEFTAGLIGPLVKGACMVYSRLRGPDHLRELLRVERINVLIGVPAIYQNVLKAIETKIAAMPNEKQQQVAIARKLVGSNIGGSALNNVIMQDVLRELGGNIKFWAAGGAPVPAEVVTGLASFGIPVLAGYGLTEASPIVAANTHAANRPGSVGKPLDNVEVRIAENGEILVRAPSVMHGYVDDPKATEEVLKDGWLYTGDVGRLDEDGYLYVTGRIKSTIVTAGGYNIHPEELEYALEQSPLIKEASVFGLQTSTGEQPHGIIVPSADHIDKANDKDFFRAEIARCFADLAEYKRLAGFEVYSGELPRTRTNKIQRSKAAELYQQLLENNGAGIPPQEPPAFDEHGASLRDVVMEILAPDVAARVANKPVGLKTTLAGELGIDSFARLELTLRLEQKFDVELPDDAVNDVQTIDELINLVRSRQGKSGDSSGDVVNCESNNFDTLMQRYAQLMPEGSPQAQRLMTSVASWPFGKPIGAEIKLEQKGVVLEARKGLVTGMRLFLRMYNGYEAIDKEKLKIAPPYILVANHTSHIDTAALFAAVPREWIGLIHPVAASDTFYRNKISAEISANVLNAVPFDRYGDFEHSMAECRAVLERGEILLMFPEGTRSMTGSIGPFRSGAAQLAIAVGCPVVPAFIEGGADILPKKARMLRPRKLRVVFGDALTPPPGPVDLQKVQEFTKQLEQAVIALKP